MNLIVSEYFYSIQGEGKTMGVPSVFIRLTACNLMCGGRGTEKDFKLHNGATWRCDSIEVWRKGKKWKTDDFVEEVVDLYGLKLSEGTHLIITGGEPVLQQKMLKDFFDKLIARLGFKPFIEIETNGTLIPKLIYNYIDLINCSPKLSNSGELKEKRIKKEVLTFFNNSSKSIFKFVISREKDLAEVIELQNKLNLHTHKIYLMPSAEDQKELKENQDRVLDYCLKYSFNFSTRLQIILWNKTTGV
tara:strand:- start:4357 stop:5094 length:738 start_codon:yes stop_codon:yes gene_type:complete